MKWKWIECSNRGHHEGDDDDNDGGDDDDNDGGDDDDNDGGDDDVLSTQDRNFTTIRNGMAEERRAEETQFRCKHQLVG